MSLVTTASLHVGQSCLLRQSTSAVLPLPTGPAIPTLNALANVFSVIYCSFLPKTKNTAGPEVRLWLARRRAVRHQPVLHTFLGQPRCWGNNHEAAYSLWQPRDT